MNHVTVKSLPALSPLPLLAVILAASASCKRADGPSLSGAKQPPAGLIATATTTAESDLKMKRASGEEAEVSSKETQQETRTFIEAGKFTKVRHLVEGTRTTRMGGRTKTTPKETPPFDNTPITYERNDGKWEVTLPGGENPAASQFKSLSNEGDPQMLDCLTGGQERKLGDRWDIDPSTVPALFGLLHPSGSLNVAWTESKEVQDLHAAVLQLTFDLTGASPESSTPGEAKTQFHLTGRALLTLCTDFQLELENSTTARNEITITSPDGSENHLSGPISQTVSVTIKKP